MDFGWLGCVNKEFLKINAEKLKKYMYTKKKDHFGKSCW